MIRFDLTRGLLSRTSLLMFLLFWMTSASLAKSLDPNRTFAVIVGVLKWEDPNIPGFPAMGRQDSEFARILEDRGISKDHIRLLLDEEATLSKIYGAIAELGARAERGDTLIFYYAGHGVLRNSKVQFLNYDWSPDRALEMTELSEHLLKAWRGGRVLLFADCCFSGALAQVSQSLAQADIPSVSLTSASADIPSQANWTFTMILNDAFQGIRWTDQNNDRRITLGDLSSVVADAMQHTELQASGYYNSEVPESLLLATVQEISTKPQVPEPFLAYQPVQVWWEGRWQQARLVESDGTMFSTEIQRYEHRETVKVGREDIRKVPLRPPLLDDATALALATSKGKYQNLLLKIHAEHDYLNYLGLRDIGFREGSDKASKDAIPSGYWVYVYPNWYIWGETTE